MSDPFAAYGGTSATATPDPQAQQGAADPFASYGGTSAAAPPPPAPPQSLGERIWDAQKTYNPTVGLISGALKEAQKHIAGAVDLADKYVVQRTTRSAHRNGSGTPCGQRDRRLAPQKHERRHDDGKGGRVRGERGGVAGPGDVGRQSHRGNGVRRPAHGDGEERAGA